MNWHLAAAAALCVSSPVNAATNWTDVDTAMGRPGAVQAGDVHRYSFPRSDLSVTLDGVRIKPALALGSWLAFRDMGDRAEVMGDLVVTQEEVNPVISRLLEGGLTITALHNHLLRSSPATMYMHVHGRATRQGSRRRCAGRWRRAARRQVHRPPRHRPNWRWTPRPSTAPCVRKARLRAGPTNFLSREPSRSARMEWPCLLRLALRPPSIFSRSATDAQ